MNSRKIPLLLAVVALVIATGTAAAAVRGSPDITASLQEDTIAAGDETTLEVVLVNSGEIEYSSGASSQDINAVTTARALQVEMESGSAPISVRTNTRSLGSLTTDAPTTAAFDISVDEDAEPGTYRVPVEVRYDHYRTVAKSGARTSESVTKTRYVEVTVSDDATFDVTNVTSDAQVGSSGTVDVTVENTGQTAANNSEVTLTSQNGELTFGERTESTRSVDYWAPGERRTFEYDITAASDAKVESYPFQLNVAFDNPDGVRKESTGTSVSIVPDAEQSFSMSNVDSSLRVGEDGDLTARVTNDGPNAVDNVVVKWQSDKSNLDPQETEIAVGNLESGAATNVSFGVEATDSAEAGSKQFDFVASYRNGQGDRVDSDTLEVQAPVEQSQDEFAVEPANATVGVGQSNTIEVTVTNTRDVPLTDISAKLFASSPINTDDSEAFIDGLAPGESTTVTFSVNSDGSALQKTYPLSIDFEYDEPDGDTVTSDTYRVPISVTDPNGGGGLPLTAIGGVAVVLVLAVGGYMRFR